MGDKHEPVAPDKDAAAGHDESSRVEAAPGQDLRADRETNYAQGSWIGGGRAQTMLSAERLSDAFKSDPTHDPAHDSSWRTHKVEEDGAPPSDEPPEARPGGDRR